MAAPQSAHVRVLEEDPDLGAGLDTERFDQARLAVVAPIEVHDVGPWSTRFDVNLPAALGLLVLDGLIALEITTARRSSLELLGSGDVIRPWSDRGPRSVPVQIAWTVRSRTTVAFLDPRFVQSALAFPEIVAALMDRLALRARELNLMLAVNALPRLRDRLLLSLWHFADRWAQVTPRGVDLRLPLTHADLSHIVGASRPSVSTAIGQLRDEGILLPLAEGRWLLCGEPPPHLYELRAQVALPDGRR